MAISEVCKFEVKEELDRICEQKGISRRKATIELSEFYNAIGVKVGPGTIRQKDLRARKEVATNVAKKSKTPEISTNSKPEIIADRKPQGGGAREGAGRPGAAREFPPRGGSPEEAEPPAPQVASHARALIPLPANLRAAAWKRAVETAPGGKVTARHVGNVVRQMMPTARRPRFAAYDQDEADVVSAEFRGAYDAFFLEIQKAKAGYWKTTDKNTAVRYANNLIALITE